MRRSRSADSINNMQFGFSSGKCTTDSVLIIKHMQKNIEVSKDQFFTFVDLEKAYDGVSRDLVYWCMRKRGFPEKLVRLVETTYHRVRTVVRTARTDGSSQRWPTQGSRTKPIPVYRSTRCHQRRVHMRTDI